MPIFIKKPPKKADLAKEVAEVVVTASNKKKSFKRIYDLPKDVQDLINSMLLKGAGVPAVIDVLRAEYKLFTDISDNTLTKFFYRYKWEVVDKGLAVTHIVESMSEAGKVALAQAITELDVLREFSELIVVQKGRVNKLLLREKDMPMLFNSLGGEMKTLAGFLQQYADHAFEIGVIRRTPKLTKITSDGDSTTIESEARGEIAMAIEDTAALELAASRFMKVIEAIPEVLPDEQ